MSRINASIIEEQAEKHLNQLVKTEVIHILQQARDIMKHCRRNKLTVEDIKTVMRVNNMDAILGYRNNPTLAFRNNPDENTDTKFEDKILYVSNILSSRIPEIPVETSFEVDWFVVEGKQISHLQSYNKDKSQDKDNTIQLHKPSIHTLSFECELYLNNIKSTMFVDKVDCGLKQILPYLINWIQSEVQSIMKSKPEDMLSYLSYLMHITHSLILNPNLNTVLYLHILLPCILSCCVGKSLCAFPDENHWELRNLSAVIISEIYRKFGKEYPKMYKQILVTLNKVLHNPKSTLPSIYGVIQAITHLGESTIELLLLPVFKEIVENMNALLKSTQSLVTQMQIQRCMYAVAESVGIYWKSLQQKIELSDNIEIIGKDIRELVQKLPESKEFPLPETLLPLCYCHVPEVWDICDIVI